MEGSWIDGCYGDSIAMDRYAQVGIALDRMAQVCTGEHSLGVTACCPGGVAPCHKVWGSSPEIGNFWLKLQLCECWLGLPVMGAGYFLPHVMGSGGRYDKSQ